MTHIENTRVVLLTALCLAVLLPVAPASAQDNTTSSGPYSKSIDLGSTTFEGCELDGDTMLARFDASRSTSVTLYDVGVFDTQGTFSVPSKEVNLAPGTTTVEMPVTVKEGNAALFIRSGSDATGCTKGQDRAIFGYEAGWIDVRLVFLAQVLAAPLTFAAVARRYKQRYDERRRLL
jgi:hypothetical protein